MHRFCNEMKAIYRDDLKSQCLDHTEILDPIQVYQKVFCKHRRNETVIAAVLRFWGLRFVILSYNCFCTWWIGVDLSGFAPIHQDAVIRRWGKCNHGTNICSKSSYHDPYVLGVTTFEYCIYYVICAWNNNTHNDTVSNLSWSSLCTPQVLIHNIGFCSWNLVQVDLLTVIIFAHMQLKTLATWYF